MHYLYIRYLNPLMNLGNLLLRPAPLGGILDTHRPLEKMVAHGEIPIFIPCGEMFFLDAWEKFRKILSHMMVFDGDLPW